MRECDWKHWWRSGLVLNRFLSKHQTVSGTGMGMERGDGRCQIIMKNFSFPLGTFGKGVKMLRLLIGVVANCARMCSPPQGKPFHRRAENIWAEELAGEISLMLVVAKKKEVSLGSPSFFLFYTRLASRNMAFIESTL